MIILKKKLILKWFRFKVEIIIVILITLMTSIDKRKQNSDSVSSNLNDDDRVENNGSNNIDEKSTENMNSSNNYSNSRRNNDYNDRDSSSRPGGHYSRNRDTQYSKDNRGRDFRNHREFRGRNQRGDNDRGEFRNNDRYPRDFKPYHRNNNDSNHSDAAMTTTTRTEQNNYDNRSKPENTYKHDSRSDGSNNRYERTGAFERSKSEGTQRWERPNGPDRSDRSDRFDRHERSKSTRADRPRYNQFERSTYKQDTEERPPFRQNDTNSNENKDKDMIQLPKNTKEYSELPEEINDFEKMTFLSEELFKGIHEYGFKYPSQIQSKTIHIINSGCDLIAQSQSGSGKTGAFTIGSLSRIDPTLHFPQLLIIANTRLLALQIHKVVQNIATFMKVEVIACVGGAPRNSSQPNYQQLKSAHVLVGTPGRICEMLQKNVFDGNRIKTFIMDESDVLLKEDFRPQIMDIISAMNTNTQICIFSATFTKETLIMTEKFLRDPYRVTVEKEEISVKGVFQYKIEVGYDRNKFETLKDLFSQLSFNQMIIFVGSIRNAEELRNRLMDQNVEAGLVHGRMDSIDRENVLKEFRLAYMRILISTDVMCRGIDIDDLRIVINYDMPNDPETYLHRVGRSGRYGAQGIAINLCTHDDYGKLMTLTREYKLKIEDMPTPENVNILLTGMKPSVDKVSSAKNYTY
jgi:translation initiation factor 4A